MFHTTNISYRIQLRYLLRFVVVEVNLKISRLPSLQVQTQLELVLTCRLALVHHMSKLVIISTAALF